MREERCEGTIMGVGRGGGGHCNAMRDCCTCVKTKPLTPRCGWLKCNAAQGGYSFSRRTRWSSRNLRRSRSECGGEGTVSSVSQVFERDMREGCTIAHGYMSFYTAHAFI